MGHRSYLGGAWWLSKYRISRIEAEKDYSFAAALATDGKVLQVAVDRLISSTPGQNRNARPDKQALRENAMCATAILVVESLHHGENLPLTVDFCKRHIVRPSRSNEFCGRDATGNIEHRNLFPALCLGQVSAFSAPCGLH